ncbi:hypothetical protein HMPREF1992_01498 [Selenomonas sp. oral taxon 892 str. F0426]|nr:hypothetical protein HMPREF1992_01498 [Selenomonas sp. oral taxon 892 str. F0426]
MHLNEQYKYHRHIKLFYRFCLLFIKKRYFSFTRNRARFITIQ